MINDKNLKQEGADGSTNIQAGSGSVTINQGLSYSDVKEIAKDVFKANFLELSEKAAATATVRASQLVEKFLNELEKRSTEAVNNMENPAMQHALYTAQKEYAISGEEELGNLLVDILVDRASITERNLRQIVLDESLQIVPKITNSQLDSLSIVFLLRYSHNEGVINSRLLDGYFQNFLSPFVNGLSKEPSLSQHLQYCGCASEAMAMTKIEHILRKNYQNAFTRGFTIAEFIEKVGPMQQYYQYLWVDELKISEWKFRFDNLSKLDKIAKDDKFSDETLSKFRKFFNSITMTEIEAREYLFEKFDFMPSLFDIWENSALGRLNLTSVGIAIAQANIRRKTKATIDLGIWIK
jgi:hypothetical protein